MERGDLTENSSSRPSGTWLQLPCHWASLYALGEYLRGRCFFTPLHERVKSVQKVVNYRPSEKLLDGLLGMLCGAKTIAQSNVTTTVAVAVQRAFEHKGCAEASTIARCDCGLLHDAGTGYDAARGGSRRRTGIVMVSLKSRCHRHSHSAGSRAPNVV